jgi:hypothetical protein
MEAPVTSTRRRGVVLIEPDINSITRRFGLPIVAQCPPLAQVRLAGQLRDADVSIADLRVPDERARLLARIRKDPPALVAISLTFTSNGDEAIDVAAAVRGSSLVFRYGRRSDRLPRRRPGAPGPRPGGHRDGKDAASFRGILPP